MNRRSAWILSAMGAGIMAVAVVTMGASTGQFGFGDKGSAALTQPAEAQQQAISPQDTSALTVLDTSVDTEDERDDEHERGEHDGHDSDHGEWNHEEEDD